MKNSKKTVKGILVGAVALAMGITVLFAGAGKTYAAGEASLNKKSFNVLTRRTFDLDVADAPKDAVITWKSSNPAVAVVDDKGVVTGITKGEAKIICEVTAAGETQKLTATAKVRKPAVKIEIINKIEKLEWGKEYDLNRSLAPSRSNDVTTWTSSDETVAIVDKNGVVEALADGTVTITATTMSGKTDSVEITVYGEPDPTPTPAPTATPVPGATATPKPTQAPKATATPKPTQAPKATATPKPQKPAGDVIELAPLQPEGVTVNGNKATMEPGYLSAIYPLPETVDGSKVAAVTVVFASDQQICIKLKAADADVIPVDYPNWGVTAMTEATKTYEVPAGSAAMTHVEFMSLDNKVNVEVKSVKFTMRDAGAEKEEPKQDLTKGTALKLADAVVISGDAPAVNGDKITFTTNNNKCAFVLPAPVAAGDKVTFTADFSFTALDPASVVRFYLIQDSDAAKSEVFVIKNGEVSAKDVQQTVTLTANGDANMLLMTNFNWDGSTPQAVTVNGIKVH